MENFILVSETAQGWHYAALLTVEARLAFDDDQKQWKMVLELPLVHVTYIII